jgi:hypothetical protein
MNEIIYLESDDDIASVIGRIKAIEADGVSLMIPRGGTIGQSIVNLKLLKREIEKQNKIISLITADKISRNLAAQVGVTVYPGVDQARNAKPIRPKPVTMEDTGGDEIVEPADEVIDPENEIIEPASSEELSASGFIVNRYDKAEAEEKAVPEKIEEQTTEPEIETNPIIEDEEEIEAKEASNPIKPTEVEHINKEPEMIITSNSNRGNFEPRMKQEPAFRPKKVGSRKGPLLIIISAFVLVAIALSYIFLPYTTAAIQLNSTDYEKAYNFTVDKALKDINATDLAVPGTEQSTQGDLSRDFNSTGTQDAGTKASGDIIFYNAYSSTDQQTVPDGSIVSAQGLQFVTVGAVTIPVATSAVVNGKLVVTPGQIKGHITASQAGDKYNLTPAKFTIEAFSGDKRMNVYGQTTAALAGGTTKTIKVVSADDIKAATDSLTKDLTTELSDQIQTELTKTNEKLLTTTVAATQVALENTNKEGDQADKFTVKLTLKVIGISFSETILKQLLSGQVQKDIGDNQMIINAQNTVVTYDFVSYDKDKGTVAMTSKFDTKTGKKINPDDIKNNIKYKKYGTVRDYILSLDGVKDVNLTVWPSFLARTPLIKSRIKITFGYQN